MRHIECLGQNIIVAYVITHAGPADITGIKFTFYSAGNVFQCFCFFFTILQRTKIVACQSLSLCLQSYKSLPRITNHIVFSFFYFLVVKYVKISVKMFFVRLCIKKNSAQYFVYCCVCICLKPQWSFKLQLTFHCGYEIQMMQSSGYAVVSISIYSLGTDTLHTHTHTHTHRQENDQNEFSPKSSCVLTKGSPDPESGMWWFRL